MRIRCLCKNRNRYGVIESCTLQKETGEVFNATSQQIKRAMKQNHGSDYYFTNLQLDRIGRLIDKQDDNATSNFQLTGKPQEIFERTFVNRFIHDPDLQEIIKTMTKEFMSDGFTDIFQININNDVCAAAGENSAACDRLVEKMCSSNQIDQFMIAIPYIFERYITQNPDTVPHPTIYKLHIKTKNDNVNYIQYRSNPNELSFPLKDAFQFNPQDLSHQNNPVRKKYGRQRYYFDPTSYVFKAIKVGTSTRYPVSFNKETLEFRVKPTLDKGTS